MGDVIRGKTYAFSLPWAPSVNTYWRIKGRMVFLSAKGKEYRSAVVGLVQEANVETIEGRVGIDITAYPPDNRRRDLDNVLKAILDSLEHSGVFKDDAQVDELRITRGPVVQDGMIDVIVQELTSRCKIEPL